MLRPSALPQPKASPAGNYSITPALGTLSALNYNFVFANGNLAISAAASGPYKLTVSITGNGSVHSVDGNISCDGTTGCSFDYASGAEVVLNATASNSTFVEWTGACTGNGTCTVTMDAVKNVEAIFTAVQNVKIGSNFYEKIQDAYNVANDLANLEVRDLEFIENLLFNRAIAVTFDGGKDTGWNAANFTTVNGSVTISAGTVTVKGLAIK